ncbi:MAG TPA: hypothetical protein VFH78_05570 [Candidatus Thermoplasmatota archaeon]|nr:hypothetical protein [Candidatus Thermoplasmatota archaeon]
MRVGPILAGSFLLLVGLAAVVAGGMMKSFGDACVQMRCDDGEAYFAGMLGSGALLGGALAGLAGIGLIVAGVIAQPTARQIPVQQAAASRPCPQCAADAPRTARYCPSCGTAIAPVLAGSSRQ